MRSRGKCSFFVNLKGKRINRMWRGNSVDRCVVLIDILWNKRDTPFYMWINSIISQSVFLPVPKKGSVLNPLETKMSHTDLSSCCCSWQLYRNKVDLVNNTRAVTSTCDPTRDKHEIRPCPRRDSEMFCDYSMCFTFLRGWEDVERTSSKPHQLAVDP